MKTWIEQARFGMFIHWGHSSQQGCELSWPLVGGVFSLPFCGNIPVEEYHSTAKTFNPQQYHPQEWANLAKRLGMQYAILTTKHHDGFAMFHTKQLDFSIQNAPYKKDIVREFVEAMRLEGIRIGLYFSLIDWHHPDYPAFTEADKPYQTFQHRQPTPEQWQRYINFMFAQVRELLTNYGNIDVIWFDGSWERSPEQWQAEKLYNIIRSLQPEILISDRLPGFGDFTTPEQFIPPQPPDQAWETCMTINESWGYNTADTNFKSPRQLIHTLCEVAGKGGNLLLNISPMGDGQIQPELLERLAVVETWMRSNKQSIIGTQPGLEPWQFYGPSTRKDNQIYLHLLWKPYETISVRGIPIKKVQSVSVLASGTPLQYTTRCSIIESFNPNPIGEITITVPESVIDPYATVITIDIEW
ncbi:alpha-L-fucosidase [Iningainema tapete]|uniref:alpha-L-fucosidase n=1 Tax=Iningainema tapete BLCC-T55 TaxID=2748662 RepID=A0A8J6XKQ5_9CYAN|nr:alpha-L-fucosidase [Iningainema tapete]MBD2778014.1 alpha-L-fucosidase [Iningainema tapete BLCC-T55]